MKKILLQDYVCTVSAVLTLIAIYTLPVVSGTVAYTSINWTWSDLEDIGISNLGKSAGFYTVIAAIFTEVSSRFLSAKPGLIKIGAIAFIVAALWLFIVTLSAVGESGPHALTGLPLYVILLGGGVLLKGKSAP
jgi:hypothetical protein